MNNFTQFQKNFENEKKFMDRYYDYTSKWYDFSVKYARAIANATTESIKSFEHSKNRSIYSKQTQNQMRKTFDSSLQEQIKKEDFTSSVSDYLIASLSFAEYFGIKKGYQHFMDFFSAWNKPIETIRDDVNRSAVEVIKMDEGFQLLHYKPLSKKRFKTPLLMVYSLINRHYILDLLPKVSVIRQFLEHGFDVYATDWTTSSSAHKSMTLEELVQTCVGNSVKKVQEITGEQKISLFGYCWGGIFTLAYSALHTDSVRNLILHATPVDLEKPNTVIENLTKHVDADKLVDELGNVPGSLINMAFILRNPLEAALKYSTFFSKPRNSDEIMQFFAIETWLYDSRPIIGEIYREIVDKIYKKNLLIKNKLKVGTKTVDLNNLTMPVLNIIGLKDDLVPPESGRYIMCEIPSKDKKLIEFPTGHVGLCISKKAHEQLWPEVTKWLASRSS